MNLTIKITKDILERSKMCNWDRITTHCAIALAVCGIFPKAEVNHAKIFVKGERNRDERLQIDLPFQANNFITKFDRAEPDERINLPEFSFQISVPDELINEIGIEQAHEIIRNSQTLELV